MDYITTSNIIGKIGNIEKVVTDYPDKITIHMPNAKTDVIDIIGQDKYDEIFVKEEDDEDRVKIANAESYFALCYIVPAINNESAGAGITKSTGFGDGRKENLSEFDINSIIERYRATANKILSKYALAVDNDEDDNPDLVRAGSISMTAI